ncbi:TetR/AcrR family transcriptional regulator [Mycobacterium alsense]|uniref:TetR/AcrR family transcriptional regulator n=2 Tax=Mycobacterium alsense TaxID=324058 RepID=A0AA41XK64_9MYCO|nr:TetR/AcrR family transcriptional regulator [Mycobacterium alsense]MCV7377911.1 TetR/AcrR family transcriptional regulator [Mycobacterium alsense]
MKKTGAHGRASPRRRRARTGMREALLQAALAEFGAKGFDGASTRAIAARVDAHQPQINYHFESKAALWTSAVNYLFGLLHDAMDGVLPAEPTNVEVPQLAAVFADGIRRFVAFAAEHPELNQIMVHEGTADSDRLAWLTQTHVKPIFEMVGLGWRMLQHAGVAARVDGDIFYYLLIGGASIPYVNAPEVRLLTGRDPNDAGWITAHADALITILLPGMAAATL